MQSPSYLPEPCLLSPEQVTEFPNPSELSRQLRERLADMSRWEAIDPARYTTYADDPGELYLNNLCHAPGWKTGGWTRWSPADPVDRPCPECGTEMMHAVPALSRRRAPMGRLVGYGWGPAAAARGAPPRIAETPDAPRPSGVVRQASWVGCHGPGVVRQARSSKVTSMPRPAQVARVRARQRCRSCR